MAWDRIHKTIGGNGQVTMTPGYLSETITLADGSSSMVAASTSAIDYPIKSDYTLLIDFSSDLANDSFVRVEHSWDGTTWVKEGKFETGTASTSDLSDDMSKLGIIDVNIVGDTRDGLMLLYDIDGHGKGKYTRFTIECNADLSTQNATFYIVPHF